MGIIHFLHRLKTFIMTRCDSSTTEETAVIDRDRDFKTDAATVAHTILDQFSPENVLHVGCGIGLHMKPFLDAGIDTHGIDPSSVSLENAMVPEEIIEIHDLQQPYTADREYDLVVCLETLEYASETQANTILESISNAGNTAVISIPTEPHRPSKQEWIQRFETRGMTFHEDETRRLQDTLVLEEEAWVPDHLLVFQKQ